MRIHLQGFRNFTFELLQGIRIANYPKSYINQKNLYELFKPEV